MQDTIQLDEGLVRNEDIFDVALPDSELLTTINQRITTAEGHWYGKEWNLKQVYKDNKNQWLPNHLLGEERYRHESDYQDPRSFVATETLVSQANARVANPEVSPGTASKASQQLAKDLEVAMVAWCRLHNVKKVQRQVTRGVFINRHAYAYFYYDEDFGPNGDICVEYVSGTEILPDPDAKEGEDPRYMIRDKKASVQELIQLFPEKKADILKELGIRGVKTQMGQIVAYKEVWFRYLDEDEGDWCIAVACKLNKLIMGKLKNPNWNETGKNFLPKDQMPFIPIHYLNLGDSFIDHTTLLEQTRSAQKNLDKRGKQATDITDQAQGGLIFNSQMISKKEGQKLTGHPKEKVFVDGDVRSAVIRLAPADISPGVIADKADSRSVIDNTFGTHAPTRGEASGNATLGQDVLQSQKDLTRNDELIRSIDQFFHDFFNMLVQMMVVWYTKEHWFTVAGDDGQFDEIAMTSKNIEDGCQVFVEPGSTLPIDKAAMRETGLALAKMQLTDPLSLYEDLGLPNPQKRLARLMDWLTNPRKLVQDADDETFDRKAFMDIQVLIGGQEPEVRQEINDRYIGFFTAYIKSGTFQDLEKKTQKAIVKFLRKEVEVLQRKLELEQTTLPTPEEMAAGNQAAVERAGQQQQIMQANPADPAGAAMASAAQAPDGATGATTPEGQPQQPAPQGTSQAVQQMQQTPAASTPTV